MAEFSLETDRLVLREWREDDVDPIMEQLNTTEVTRWLDGPKPRDHYVALCDRMAASQAEHGHSFWIVENKQNAAVLGFCGARVGGHPGTPVHGEIELGWRLGANVWGKGYALEAAQASIDWCWNNLPDCTRLIAYTVPENIPSWRLMKRLGMKRLPELDFEHPAFAPEHPLSQHITYALDRSE